MTQRPWSSENEWAGFVRKPSARYERRFSRAASVATSVRSHSSNVIVSSSRARGCSHGASGSSSFASASSFASPSFKRALVGRRQAALAARVPSRVPVLVDVDVVSVAVGGEEVDAELLEQRVHARLVRRDPLAAELVRLAAELGVPEPSADAIARFEHDDLAALGDEAPRGGETCDAGADDGDVRLDHAGAHASFLSAAAAAARPVRTAPSM